MTRTFAFTLLAALSLSVEASARQRVYETPTTSDGDEDDIGDLPTTSAADDESESDNWDNDRFDRYDYYWEHGQRVYETPTTSDGDEDDIGDLPTTSAADDESESDNWGHAFNNNWDADRFDRGDRYWEYYEEERYRLLNPHKSCELWFTGPLSWFIPDDCEPLPRAKPPEPLSSVSITPSEGIQSITFSENGQVKSITFMDGHSPRDMSIKYSGDKSWTDLIKELLSLMMNLAALCVLISMISAAIIGIIALKNTSKS